MQTQGCTCLPSGTAPHADAGESQPVSVTMHSGGLLLRIWVIGAEESWVELQGQVGSGSGSGECQVGDNPGE